MLSYLLNKNYDDQMTKCFLITAITKIHSKINYLQLSFISDIMEKYSRIKNPELQQRCLEYKRTQSKNISLNLNNNINSEINIDQNLSFLNEYSNSKSNGKVYNPELSDFYADKFSNPDTKLNIGPYQVSSNLFSMPGKSENLNNLYETNDNYLATDIKSELNVKAEKKWDLEGYKGEIKKSSEKPQMTNMQSIGGVKSDNYSGVSSQNQNGGNYDHYANNSMNNINKKKKIEEYDPNSQQKKQLMKDLFGGMDGSESNTKKENIKKANKQKEQNLFSDLNVNTNTNKNETNTNTNAQMNLFEGLTQNNNNSNQSNQVTNNQNQNNNSQGIDLLGDIFGSTFNSNSNNNSNNNNNLFANLSPPLQANYGNNSNFNNFTPLNINTDKFGEMWENSPDEDTFELNANIQSPQQFHEIIKSKGNFAAVDIINNEAISAANYKNEYVLVHATIEMNQITLLVKCQNKSYNNEVGNFVMGLFK
jgi:hypothetical protein